MQAELMLMSMIWQIVMLEWFWCMKTLDDLIPVAKGNLGVHKINNCVDLLLRLFRQVLQMMAIHVQNIYALFQGEFFRV